MRKFILILIAAFLVVGCSRTIYVPVESKITITETVRDTVIDVRIEREYVKNITPDTTSTVETKYARSTATYHGDTGLLEHDIANKEDNIPVHIQHIDREVIKEVPAPYPVEVEVKVEKPVRMPLRWWEKLFLYAGIASASYGAFRLYRGIKG